MKSRKYLAAILICASLCGCAGTDTAQTAQKADEPVGTSTAAPESESTETEVVSETEADTAAPAADSSTAETEAAADRGKTIKYNDWAGFSDLPFYEIEATVTDFEYIFDYTYGYRSTGVYDSSKINPDHFDLENYLYLPEVDDEELEFIEIRAGQEYDGLTVKTAATAIARSEDQSWESYIMEMMIQLEGEHEFIGNLNFYYDDDYMVSAGDLNFIPIEGLKGVPLVAACKPTNYISDDFGLRCELSSGLWVGNLFSGVAGNIRSGIWYSNVPPEITEVRFDDGVMEKLNAMFGDATEICTKQVKLTVSFINISWNDNFGCNNCSAIIKDVTEI